MSSIVPDGRVIVSNIVLYAKKEADWHHDWAQNCPFQDFEWCPRGFKLNQKLPKNCRGIYAMSDMPFGLFIRAE